MASGLFTLIVLSPSMIRPPPSPTSPSPPFPGKPSPPPPPPPLPSRPLAVQPPPRRTRPYKTPKIFLSFGAFSLLDPGGHFLELVPRPGWCPIPILSKKILSIKQDSYI